MPSRGVFARDASGGWFTNRTSSFGAAPEMTIF
jgi:hypothetical protein